MASGGVDSRPGCGAKASWQGASCLAVTVSSQSGLEKGRHAVQFSSVQSLSRV